MKNKNIEFSDDQIAVAEREIKSAYGALGTLLEWIKTNELNSEMKETLPNLIDSYMDSVKKAIGYVGEKSERVKEIEKSINKYHQEQIQKLEDALENANSISSIPANVKLAFDKIKEWWDVEGFSYISDYSIVGSSGVVSAKLGFMLDSFTSRYSETPVLDGKRLQTKKQYLIDKGFEFTPKKEGYGSDLIDNDNNRKLLEDMVCEAFPSAKIWSIENRLRQTNSKKDSYLIIRTVDVTISDIKDIEKLVVKDKYFAVDEDEYI